MLFDPLNLVGEQFPDFSQLLVLLRNRIFLVLQLPLDLDDFVGLA